MLALYISLGVIGLLFIIFFILLACLHHSTFYSPLGRQNDDHVLTPATYELGIDKEIYSLIFHFYPKDNGRMYRSWKRN